MRFEMIFVGVIIVLFIFLGVIFSMGKGAFLIAGINTMSKEEKAKYNISALCKFMGKFMFVIAFSILLFALGEVFEKNVLFIIGQVIMYISIIFTLIYMNVSKKFKK
ncbi:DUF3784 domain-containing protein [Clostridium sardiniense]|uniref:DUF3784 domain-containing protein n=1 Tax=Clostridium sardiniense TaxID=29369 RepID=UPI003D341137